MCITDTPTQKHVGAEVKGYITTVILSAMREGYTDASIEIRDWAVPAHHANEKYPFTMMVREMMSGHAIRKAGGCAESGLFEGTLSIQTVILDPSGKSGSSLSGAHAPFRGETTQALRQRLPFCLTSRDQYVCAAPAAGACLPFCVLSISKYVLNNRLAAQSLAVRERHTVAAAVWPSCHTAHPPPLHLHFMCVCVWVGGRVTSLLPCGHLSLSLSRGVYIAFSGFAALHYIYISIYACPYACTAMHTHVFFSLCSPSLPPPSHTHIHTHIYIYIYICVCVYVCVREGARREGGRESFFLFLCASLDFLRNDWTANSTRSTCTVVFFFFVGVVLAAVMVVVGGWDGGRG
ncbi:hypothetical protein EIN_156310, partial [Entamoeba invadens IP1]